MPNEWISVLAGRAPLAIGAVTLMVRMIIPILSPCFSTHGKKALSGVTRIMIRTRIETATVVLWLMKPSAGQTQEDQQGGIEHRAVILAKKRKNNLTVALASRLY